MGSSTGRFDVGTERPLASAIRGRADELNLIAALVTAAAQGRGGAWVIESPPGVGKSRFLTKVMVLAAMQERSPVRMDLLVEDGEQMTTGGKKWPTWLSNGLPLTVCS